MLDSENGKKETSVRFSNVESLPERVWDWQSHCRVKSVKENFGFLSGCKFVLICTWSSLGCFPTTQNIICTSSLPALPWWHCQQLERGPCVHSSPPTKCKRGEETYENWVITPLIYFYKKLSASRGFFLQKPSHIYCFFKWGNSTFEYTIINQS